MAFYYEADHSKWSYKERYNSWQEFPPKTCRSLEKLWKKVHLQGDNSEVEFKWEKDKQPWVIDVQQLHTRPAGKHYFRSTLDVSRTGYPYPKMPGDKKKLGKLFDKYADKEEPDFMDDEKVMKCFSDCKTPADQVDCLILHAICGAKDLMAIERDAFVEGLSLCGCSDVKTISQRVQEIKSKMTSNSGSKVIKLFAKYIFRMICEDARQRSLPIIAITDEDTGEEVTPLALIVFKMMYVEGMRDVFPFGENFLQYLMDNPMIGDDQVKAVTCDDWTMIAEFLLQSKTDDKFDDELSDWPLLIESYMSWNLQGKAKAMTS